MPTTTQLLRSIARTCALAAAAGAMASCLAESATGPNGGRRPPYLAVVVTVDAPPEVTSRGPYTFRVRELSGTLGVDTTFRASPRDTVILSVTAASYRVDIGDVPPTCGVRDGTAQAIVVPPNSNTSLVRFSINCAPALVVAAYTDGVTPDPDYVLSVQGAQGEAYAAVLAANDTVRIPGLPAGRYEVTLRHVASNCVLTNDGANNVTVTIAPSGGAFVPFRVVCSDIARRPKVVQFSASYLDGTIGYVLRAADPDKDIERTFVDVTDCNKRSQLAAGGRRRGGFSGAPNVTLRDTAVIIGAYDLGVSDNAFVGRCLATWVADERGNTSDWVEIPLVKRDAARSPVIGSFNAKLNGTQGLLVDAALSDPNGDLLGIFVVYLLRDAVVSFPADGQPDRLLAQPAGIIGTVVPELPLGVGFGLWNDYLGAIIYALDRAGNFTRREDNDLAR